MPTHHDARARLGATPQPQAGYVDGEGAAAAAIRAPAVAPRRCCRILQRSLRPQRVRELCCERRSRPARGCEV